MSQVDAKYTLMLHSKISFVRMAFQRFQPKYNFTHYAWVDFGISHGRKNFIPRHVCWDPLGDAKLHFVVWVTTISLSRVNVTDDMITPTIDNASPVMGYSFIIPSEQILWYERVYTKMYFRCVPSGIVRLPGSA